MNLCRKLKIIALTLILTFGAPAIAGAYNFGSYTPPTEPLTTDSQIIDDANEFIQAYYDLAIYFEPQIRIIDETGNKVTSNLRVEQDYNISDEPGSDNGFAKVTAPILYYEKPGCGPGRNQQYLGQTKDGYTITNVRFPLNASWSFLEDLNWVFYGNYEAFAWWKSQGNSIPDPQNLVFNKKADVDPDYAQMLDFCIGGATIPQLRNWNGKQYYISKAMADPNGNPGVPGKTRNFHPEIATKFPWHKYVNILMPPTFNTWGYGIGFYRDSRGFHYKSFPIMPLKCALAPDFYPTSDKYVYTGQPGQKVQVKVTLWNRGEYGVTDFAWAEYGKGWANATWLDREAKLGKWGKKDYTVEFTVGQTEKKYVFRANVDGKTPETELDQSNNTLIITVRPASVDLACSIKPVKTVYRTREFPAILGATWKAWRKDDGNFDVQYTFKVQVVGTNQQQSGKGTMGVKDFTSDTFTPSFSKPGKYTFRVEVWPVGYTDVDPSDNVATCTVTIQKVTPPPSTSTDSDIRGGLGSM